MKKEFPKNIPFLTTEEVEQRRAKGFVNQTQHSITKSTKQILKENICTLFNLLNVLIAVALILVGAYSNTLFIAIILANVIIGIAQELHAKKLVDELSLLMIPEVNVVRDGEEKHISVDDIVLDDIMILDSGTQVCCDSQIVYGAVEVNESLLTGESDAIHKEVDGELLSGSSIISGKCYAKVMHIGNDNYAAKIANEVKKVRNVQSELLNSMRKVTKITCLMIIPLGILLFVQAYFVRDQSLQSSVISSSAGLLGMLPKGLVLLISVSLAAGVGKLAKQKILIQDLYSLETLAHIDTLCLDKTGTITSGNLEVEQVISFVEDKDKELQNYVSSTLYYSDDNNATYEALCSYFPKHHPYQPSTQIPFSSLRKWSASSFEGFGTLIIGAPDKLLQEIPTNVRQYIQSGKRVIIIGRTTTKIEPTSNINSIEPLYAIVLSDTLRANVSQTLAYFKEEGIDIKIISGDHVDTVSAIAKEAGLSTYDRFLDMSSVEDTFEAISAVVEQYSVFGRVTPNQKRLLVQALQAKGHSVAMTGDGVNDMLALKEADCSIAIAQGSDAVKQMSQVVLLNSEFSYLPDVLLEGRRVVNNMGRVAGVFFIKTIYSVILSILCVLFNFPFPFLPIQITLIDLAVEAFPAFLTILEPNIAPIKGKFLPSVFQKALPNAVAILIVIFMIQFTNPFSDSELVETMMYFCVAIISMQAVIRSCIPFTRLRICVCSVMVVGFILAVFLFPNILHIPTLSFDFFKKTLLVSTIGILISISISMIIEFFSKKEPKQKQDRVYLTR